MSQVRKSKFSFVSVVSVGAAMFLLAAFAIAEHHESEPSVALAKSTYAPGEDIVVNFSNGPGNKDDWIGIYKAGEEPGSNFTRLWLYTDGTNAKGKMVSALMVADFAVQISQPASRWMGV